ncbi:cobaltochelatase subunit CobN [Aliterella atlantica]|uniref:Cobalamin biosynthesis protein CobN n=1 Tax=Aliterella atlantica CENA595 TaxID=1618023 RepID=A0A0D8ZVV2_9CYAN|nr:cobaltochelatase subunit CobN [Aliterella atlantica]KJH72875.1 cobalamin biosynthesis protein CobN [Aliterella atlantica CENA595]
MHRINATPGGWNPQAEGVIFLNQDPAPIIFLTAADTDIQTLAAAVTKLPPNFPALRVANLLHLQQQLTIDTYAEEVLEKAQVIILRLLGGRSYWSYGLEVVQEIVKQTGTALIVMPGDDRLDPDLVSHSTVSLSIVNQLWRYFTEGGVENTIHALQFISDTCLQTKFNPPPPQSVPRVGLYPWDSGKSGFPQVGILFYRAHYLAADTLPIDALCQALVARNLEPVPIFVSSLRDTEVQAEVLMQLRSQADIQVLLNTTSFSLAKLDADMPQLDLWQTLDVPVLQVILSGGTAESWTSGLQGLSPRDMAMNVALPEVDGRIISRAISFKAVQAENTELQTDVVVYEPVSDRVEFVAQLAKRWVSLKMRSPKERRVALILANYPNRDGRLANGVGLDTPASCVEILQALQAAGYRVDNLPATGDELIALLASGVTNDPQGQFRAVRQFVSVEEYQKYFDGLPENVIKGISDRWGSPHNHHYVETLQCNVSNPSPPPHNTTPHSPNYAISGVQFGNIFVGIQPSRGYDIDPSLNYHAPDLEPTHDYLAFYYWVRKVFSADAVVHVGKHGNLEWLPGKSIALSNRCYPEVALGALPHFYPFIVNDPGEGSQAKRRSGAVILDHLTPPMTRAELYGNLQQLEGLIDEYYEAQSLDPGRVKAIASRITDLVIQENIYQDLGVEPTEIFTYLDGYLCELKEAQIRDGLHIFGQCPQGRQLRDLIVAIARQPSNGRIGLTRAIAQDWGLDFDPLTADLGLQLSNKNQQILNNKTQNPCRTIGDAVEILEQHAADLVDPPVAPLTPPTPLSSELSWICDRLLPALQSTNLEITNLLRGLNGQYIPSGASGAPTRGRPEVLPTGRNFYSVDIRGIPTETAWDIGRKAAEALIERYTQENGEYPQTLGLSVWGTSTMRTGGDDLAEAMALLGVQPVWDGVSRRLVDFEILPLSILGRPRVDVTLRISGFFRDAFPNLIDLFSSAVAAVAALDEPAQQNPLAAQVKQETQQWQNAGLSQEAAQERSQYRIFGSKPGAYGAGLQGLIEAQNWNDDADLARAYINWSCYAYGTTVRSAPEAFAHRLKSMQVVLHNQDNREHDLLDSDDYYQFQGGLTAAVRALTGKNPQTYFGDNSIPANPRIRQLKEEIARVYRSRVVNPKWISGVMRHGYKGAFEMAATVDYLFAYDATAGCVEDYMYQGIASAYLFEAQVQDFVQAKNPWALRDMAERLLEAHQRGLWANVDAEVLDKLRAIALQAEAIVEEK